jgi:hypothetical protein
VRVCTWSVWTILLWVVGMDGRAGLDTEIGVAKWDMMYLREDASIRSRPLA